MLFDNRRFLILPRKSLVLAMSVVLSACGGGGGGGGSSGGGAAPTATSASLAAVEDTPANGTLTASDPDGDALTYRIMSNGSKGVATVTNPSTGSFTYTPNADETGTDNFSFKANDGASDSNAATVTVTISPVDDPPVAQAGGLATNEDTAASGTLIASDAEMQPLTYSIVGNGTKGTATITDPATGAYTYMPNLDEHGADSFTFKANDGSQDSNTATVSVSINDAPVATAGCGTTPQSQTLAGTLSATDLETPTMLMFALGANGADGAGPITTAKGGTVTLTNATTGDFIYEPASSGARGTDSFEYQVTDADGASDSVTQTVIVDPHIMPLGDSITSGVTDGTAISPPPATRVGYRKPLYDSLIAAGYTFDFVGSLTHGNGVANFDFNHEGHGGWSANELAFGMTGFPSDGIQAWLGTNPADVVLLHAGTNGLAPGGTNVSEVASILDEIDQWEGSAGGNPVTVILAKIIDQDPENPDVDNFNNSLVTMANTRIGNGDDIVLVDQHDALNYPADLNDQFHPNTTGYSKMANVWLNALGNVLDKCP